MEKQYRSMQGLLLAGFFLLLGAGCIFLAVTSSLWWLLGVFPLWGLGAAGLGTELDRPRRPTP